MYHLTQRRDPLFVSRKNIHVTRLLKNSGLLWRGWGVFLDRTPRPQVLYLDFVNKSKRIFELYRCPGGRRVTGGAPKPNTNKKKSNTNQIQPCMNHMTAWRVPLWGGCRVWFHLVSCGLDLVFFGLCLVWVLPQSPCDHPKGGKKSSAAGARCPPRQMRRGSGSSICWRKPPSTRTRWRSLGSVSSSRP